MNNLSSIHFLGHHDSGYFSLQWKHHTRDLYVFVHQIANLLEINGNFVCEERIEIYQLFIIIF